MLFIGGPPIQSRGFEIFLPFAIATNPSDPQSSQFERPAAPEVSQARGNIFPPTQYSGHEGWKIRGGPRRRILTVSCPKAMSGIDRLDQYDVRGRFG